MSLPNERRKFLSDSLRTLTLLGLSTNTAATLLEAMFNKAYAGILDDPKYKSSHKLVQILLEGAPPRWLFDLPLTPNGNDSFDVGTTGSFGNKLSISGNQVHAHHSAWKSANGLYVPPVWSMNVAGVSNFQNLLNHSLFIRGIDAEIDNHAVNRMRVDQPVIGGTSLTGAVSDISDHPIPGVHLAGSSLTFRSQKNKNAIRVSSAVTPNDHPVRRVLTPFINGGAPFYRSNSGWNSAVNQVLDQFDLYAESIQLPKSSLRENRDKADALVREGITTLVDQWASVYAKYSSIVTAALSPARGTLPGIFDKAIPIDRTNLAYQVDTLLPATSMTDLRDTINAGLVMEGMAASFAATEILFNSGVTSTMVIGISSLRNVEFGQAAKILLTNDQHAVGAVTATVLTTLQYRSLLACLTSFMDSAKAAGTWPSTIIQIGSEFNRAPRADGSGSDHGVRGSNITLISGHFDQARVIGNILVSPPSLTANYRGTWGVAATNYRIGSENRAIRYNDIARTITALTGCADIVANGSSLLKPSGQFWVPVIPEAKNVA